VSKNTDAPFVAQPIHPPFRRRWVGFRHRILQGEQATGIFSALIVIGTNKKKFQRGQKPGSKGTMSLDLPTLMIMQSFAIACSGALLCFAWMQNRAATVWGLWGVANIIAAAGIISLMLGATFHVIVWSTIGGCLMQTQAGLMWKAARLIEWKRTPLAFALAGPSLIGLGSPFLQSLSGLFALAGGATYALATAVELWAGRQERLTARWPLIFLCAVHGTALLIGTYSAFIGSTGEDSVPALMSLFGFIYFESIIFALGTSIFVFSLVNERSEVATRLAATKDSLTGIANRAAFLETAKRVLECCRRTQTPVSAIMFDLDHFKEINDKHGHAIGDAVLKRFCSAAVAALRQTDLFGRMGGEEFAALLPAVSIEAALLRAERIRLSFADDCQFVRGHRVNATVSSGVSVSMNAEQTLDALLEEADAALYRAKAEGRNRVIRAGENPPGAVTSEVSRVA
jgi:diguanylate cyclase (GGDEF)-like protein